MLLRTSIARQFGVYKFARQACKPVPYLAHGTPWHHSSFSTESKSNVTSPPESPNSSEGMLSDIWNIAPGVVEHVHTTLGLPWWATFVTCTLSLRVALLPLLVYQVRSVASFTSGATGQQMRQLSVLFQKSLSDATDPIARSQAMKLYYKGLQGIWKLNNVHPAQCIAVPLVQLPIVITFMWSTRQMIRSGTWNLSEGGILWFTDLSVPDQTLVLPVIAVALTYSSLERAFGRTTEIASVSQIARELLQTGLVISFPFIAHLPSAIFMYWIPSSLFVLAQSKVLRYKFIQRWMLTGLELNPGQSKAPRIPYPLLKPGNVVKPKT